MLDYIIIGGGIAGLYANYILSDRKQNGILLEELPKFGGRAEEVQFHNTIIKLGAGIIETDNFYLLKLLKKLDIKPSSFYSFVNPLLDYSFDMDKAINDIIKKYQKDKISISVKMFLNKYFDKDFIKKFFRKL
jgi:monoamine oxidase